MDLAVAVVASALAALFAVAACVYAFGWLFGLW